MSWLKLNTPWDACYKRQDQQEQLKKTEAAWKVRSNSDESWSEAWDSDYFVDRRKFLTKRFWSFWPKPLGGGHERRRVYKQGLGLWTKNQKLKVREKKWHFLERKQNFKQRKLFELNKVERNRGPITEKDRLQEVNRRSP